MAKYRISFYTEIDEEGCTEVGMTPANYILDDLLFHIPKLDKDILVERVESPSLPSDVMLIG